MVKVYAVRVGDKYGIEYEQYLRSKLPGIEFINKAENPFIRQWNKVRFFSLNTSDPVCVIDVDIELHNDYMELFKLPIQKGEFIGIPAWWRDTHSENYKINGGFYKFYPQDTRYIYDEFISKPEYYTTHYVKNGITVGPINGEQYFVEDMVKKKLNLKLVSNDWVQRGIEGKFLDDGIVKLVHYSWK